MDILYVSCYPEEYFERIISESKLLSSQPSQKFNKMFVSGFKQNGANISVLSTFNHIKLDKEKFWIKEEAVIEDEIKYYFLSSLKNKFFNRIYMYFEIKRFLNKWKQNYPDGIIVLDFLKPFSYNICKHGKGNKIVVIVTDLPEYLLNYNGSINKIKNKIKLYYYNKVIQSATHFVFLTEPMNNKLNIDRKPYCIIEGLVESKVIKQDEDIKKERKKICLYAGALNKQFGIANLVQAFTNEQLRKYELHLYGTGDYANEIEKIIEKNENIKYFGNVANSVVVQKEKRANVLINPRPTNEEFTKYSFPSKNMEYMVSGTPVITTCLDGMPKEYRDYVYILDNTSVDNIISCIEEVLSKPNEEINLKGQAAKRFVLENKNNFVQTKKVIDMINEK